MIATMLYSPSRGIETGAEELIDRWRQDPDPVIWADFSDNEPRAETTC